MSTKSRTTNSGNRSAVCFLLALDSGVPPAVLRDQIDLQREDRLAYTRQSSHLSRWKMIRLTQQEVGNSTAHTKNQFVADNGIVIHVGTVHSVKGETHFATLYLETEYKRTLMPLG